MLQNVVTSENPKPSNGEFEAQHQVSVVNQAEVPSENGLTLSDENTNQTKAEGADIKSEGKSDVMKGIQPNNNTGDTKTVTALDLKDSFADVKVKKEKKPTFEEDDPFAALDWKDGIATLPGNRLKESELCE